MMTELDKKISLALAAKLALQHMHRFPEPDKKFIKQYKEMTKEFYQILTELHEEVFGAKVEEKKKLKLNL